MQHRLIIFDFDGVLINSREVHFHALNFALRSIDDKFVITPQDHARKFDGLSTSKKLLLLEETRGLSPKYFETILKIKQDETLRIFKNLSVDKELVEVFKRINDNKIEIAVASNCIRKTLKTALLKLGLLEYTEIFLSNQDVKNSKPNPEIYWECMKKIGSVPGTTVIFEDSHIGRQGALASGAFLVPVANRDDLTTEKIDEAINYLNGENKSLIPWRSQKLNVLIPMAGDGSRFEKAGYSFPKPLIEVNGKPMIQVVVENLNIDARFIFIVQKTHYEKYQLRYLLNLIAKNSEVVVIESKTEGAACTSLLAEKFINDDTPLLISNSDQFIEWNSSEFMYGLESEGVDGGILTFEASHPKWSYVRLGSDGFIVEVAEKKVISNLATVGIYFWAKGKNYIKYAKQMINKNIRTNGEFYICPVFNEAIQEGLKIRAITVKKMWGLGTPEDLNLFLKYKDV
jgi:hypothetical protein